MFKNDFSSILISVSGFKRKGCHTMYNGDALVHLFNSHIRKSILITGPTVNYASRLEDIARNNEILISRTMSNKVRENFTFSEIQIKDRVKGGKIKDFEDQKFVYNIIGKKVAATSAVRH